MKKKYITPTIISHKLEFETVLLGESKEDGWKLPDDNGGIGVSDNDDDIDN